MSENGYRNSPQNPDALRVDWPAGGGMLGEEPPTMAADLMLIMMDDSSGKLRVQPRVASYALAGALLVELWLTGRVDLGNLRLAVTPAQRLPDDPVLRMTLMAATEEQVVTREALATSARSRRRTTGTHRLIRQAGCRRGAPI
jgi:hypothetical protein